METNENNHAAVTERFRHLDSSGEDKQILHNYLMSILSEGKSFLLKRSRVMIMEKDNRNKFIILEKVETDAAKFFYICPKCSNIKFSSYLSGKVKFDEFKTCVHSRLCYLLWGDTGNLEDVKNDDKEVSDIVD